MKMFLFLVSFCNRFPFFFVSHSLGNILKLSYSTAINYLLLITTIDVIYVHPKFDTNSNFDHLFKANMSLVASSITWTLTIKATSTCRDGTKNDIVRCAFNWCFIYDTKQKNWAIQYSNLTSLASWIRKKKKNVCGKSFSILHTSGSVYYKKSDFISFEVLQTFQEVKCIEFKYKKRKKDFIFYVSILSGN